jgi:hypothetical protein
VPAEKSNHYKSYDKVEKRVSGRQGSFSEEREGRYFEDVGGDGYGPGDAVFGLFQRFEVVEEWHVHRPIGLDYLMLGAA